MIWYPDAADFICANIMALDYSEDKHPHKLLRSEEALLSVVDQVKQQEHRGLSYQAALLIKKTIDLHAFAGGNHRTAYAIAKLFLRLNDRNLRIGSFSEAYAFMKDVENKTVDEIEAWVRNGA